MRAATISKNLAADTQRYTTLGVHLGRHAINVGLSVANVAKFCGVSRWTVYKWFDGSHKVAKHNERAVEKLLRIIASKQEITRIRKEMRRGMEARDAADE